MTEAPPGAFGERLVERLLAGVPERRMSEVVAERDPLGQILVQAQRASDDTRSRRRAWADGSYGPPWARGASAESTLAERFAKGDIDESEYRARLEVLRTNRPNA